MCLLPWYWMGWACPRVVIKAGGGLCPAQVHFWQDQLYTPCLAEYLYVNKLDVAKHTIHLESAAATPLPPPPPPPPPPPRSSTTDDEAPLHVLVPLGGGKDSIVVYESLRTNHPHIHLTWGHVSDGYGEYARDPFLPQVVALSSSSFSSSSVLHAEHSLVSLAWERRRNHSLIPTGHPWAALCCFDSVLLALLHNMKEDEEEEEEERRKGGGEKVDGIKGGGENGRRKRRKGKIQAICVGNEKSADFDNNIEWQGLSINHQYDKSSSFERAARVYIHTYIGK